MARDGSNRPTAAGGRNPIDNLAPVGTTEGTPRLSVVIAVKDDPEGLEQTLHALGRQTIDGVEAIVVDDGSRDGTPAVAERAGARLLRQEESRGAYVARNRGLAVAGAPVFAITDAGCIPADDWAERGVAQVGAGDSMRVVAGRIAMPLGDAPTFAAMVDVLHHMDQARYVREKGEAVTANLFFSRRAFEAAGGFDEGLSAGGDREWVRRARASGAELVYAADAVVTHPPRTRVRQLLKKSSRVAKGGSALRAMGRPENRRPYADPYTLVPRHRRNGRQRLAENGYEPSPVRWVGANLGSLAFIQIPQAVAALRADVEAWMRERRDSGRG
jgi:GT2 family glycosyltransferase